MTKSFSIGSDDTNNLVLKDAGVSKNHAKLFAKGERFTLRDLDSQLGTFVNRQRVKEKYVVCGDTISIGKVDLEIVDPLDEILGADDGVPYWSLIGDSSWLTGQEFPIIVQKFKPVTIGRGNQCDIVIPGTHLSRQHAQFSMRNDVLTVSDLDSVNGTFLNNKKIKFAQIKPGDRIRFDVYSFRVFGPGIKLPSSATTQFKAIDEKSLSDSGLGKQWRTKPTSPGNRNEQSDSTRKKKLAWIAALLVLGFFIVLVYATFN